MTNSLAAMNPHLKRDNGQAEWTKATLTQHRHNTRLYGLFLVGVCRADRRL